MIRVVSIVKHMAHGAPSAILLKSDQCLSQIDSGIAPVNLMRGIVKISSVALLKGEWPAINPPATHPPAIRLIKYSAVMFSTVQLYRLLYCAAPKGSNTTCSACLLKGIFPRVNPLLTPLFGAPSFEGTEDEQT